MEDLFKNHLTRNEENNYITDLNYLFKHIEKLLQRDNFKKNSKIIKDSTSIFESMVNLLLKKEGILVNNAPLSEILELSSENKIMPDECIEFIDTINSLEADLNITENVLSSFLYSFMFFISWFKNYYTLKFKPTRELHVEKCCSIINQSSELDQDSILFNEEILNLKGKLKKEYLPNEEHDKLFLKTNFDKMLGISSKDLSAYKEIKNEIVTLENKQLSRKELGNEFEINYIDKEIKDKQYHLDEIKISLILEQLLKTLNDLKRDIQEIKIDIKVIKEKITIIQDTLTKIQSHTDRILNDYNWSDKEEDQIIHIHTNECVDNILNYNNDFVTADLYFNGENCLKEKFGDSWNKLSDLSKTLLITSQFMYTNLIKSSTKMDYSGICILITKALEIEITERFYTNFLKYLKKQYDDEYKNYPTGLMFKNKGPLYDYQFTLGSVAYVLCNKTSKYDKKEQKKNNKKQLMDYCKCCILSKYNIKEIEEKIDAFASSIEEIRLNFRNPSAHRDGMTLDDAKKCREKIIGEFFKEMLDSFDY